MAESLAGPPLASSTRLIRWAGAAGLILLGACQQAPEGPAPDLPAAPASPSVLAAPSLPSPPASAATPLAPGQSVTAELAGGAVDAYLLALEADVFVRLSVDQPGVDVVARLVDSEGTLLIRYDRLTGTAKPERVLWVTGAAGEYRLEIKAYGGADATGTYAVSFEEQRPATARDRRCQVAELLMAEGDALRRRPDQDSRRRAEEKLQQAVDLWRELGDRGRLADVSYRLARAQEHRDRGLAIATLEATLDLLDSQADAWQVATVLHRLGVTHYDDGELRRAVELYQRALPLRQQVGHARGEALTRNGLGLAYKMLGDIPQALENYRLALELFRELGRSREEAGALHNLGKSYLMTGMFQEALDSLERALEIRERLGNQGDLASTLNAIGQAHFKAGDPQRALATQLRALALSREAGNRGFEALALCGTALAYQELGRFDDALELFEQALGSYRELDDRNNQAIALHNIGWVLDALEKDRRAAENYRQALALFEATGQRSGLILTLHSMALVERQLGELEAARGHLERALAEVERVRTRPQSHTLRYSYFATKQGYYETYVDLLMELHRRRPDAGHAAEALTASERARARSQLDALTESDADLRRGASPELLERDRALEAEIASLESQRQQLIEDGAGQPRLDAIERRLRSLFLEHDRVQAEIRVASPQYAALTQPQPLAAADIQRRVVDRDTILLEYDLGEERSYLWAVTPGEVRSFELPPRETIERTATRAYKLLSSSHQTASRVQTELTLDKLGRLVLEPVAGMLAGKRLLIVADGALQYIPFGALPATPAAESPARTTLGESHEIVSMPSASTLAVLRGQIAGRRRPAGTVAVFADPVFELDDPRFREDASDPSSSTVRGRATPEPRRYDRLIYSRREADDILALAPAGSVFEAIGFAADRDAVLSGQLADYRFLHFATHGELNTEYPELSRLVLSQLDPQGKKREGFVFAHEIYNLELAADLVVLSACETALGAEIRGEGLLGLTQGFMYAGAASVLVSLWNVDDQATAELMARFYRQLLVEELRPAAALRAAQITIRREKKWQAPYFWAGFVLQGEWR